MLTPQETELALLEHSRREAEREGGRYPVGTAPNDWEGVGPPPEDQ